MSESQRGQLRVLVCFAGVFGLFAQFIAQLLELSTGQGLTTAFVTLVTVAIGDSVLDRYMGKRGPSDSPPSPPDDPPSPPPVRPPPPRPQKRQSDQAPDFGDIESLAVAA